MPQLPIAELCGLLFIPNIWACLALVFLSVYFSIPNRLSDPHYLLVNVYNRTITGK